MSKADEGVPVAFGDPFRRKYGKLSDVQKDCMEEAKIYYENVWTTLKRLEDEFGPSRDLSKARTELQDSCMWAVRAITKMEGQT